MRTLSLKTTFVGLFFVLGGFVFPSVLNAQEMNKYDWKEYNTSFEIPENFTVQESSGEKFSAGNSNINFTIYPKKGVTTSYSEMESLLQSWTNACGVTPATEYYLDEDYNGYWNVYVVGNTESGTAVFLSLYVDPSDPDIRLYVWISYDQSSLNTAVDIMSSITPNAVVTQEMKPFDWEAYNTSFEIPQNFTVLESTGEKFSAGDGDINLTIYPVKGGLISYSEMKSLLQTWTISCGVEPIGEYKLIEDHNGYWGVIVVGSTTESAVLLSLLVDPKNPNIGLYVWLSSEGTGNMETIEKIMFSIAPIAVKTQGMETFDWNEYKTTFEIPEDFTVNESTGEKFSAGNGNINLTIYPLKGGIISYSEMKSLLQTWTTSCGVEPIGDYALAESLNGYWGAYVVGKLDEGKAVYLSLLVDPNNPEIGLYVWLAYDAAGLEATQKILLSFAPLE